jgi:hypothetical protein
MHRQPSQFQPARGIAVAFAALWSTTFLPPARAADSPTQPRSTADASDEPAYRKAIEEGLAEYDARHFEEARSLFRRAHEISPNARTFRGIGMTSFELRDYVSAVRNLSAALQDQRKPLTAEQRKNTQALLDRSRMFVDVYTLTMSPPNARVIIDGHAPEFEPDGTLVFGFGTHTVEASARGMAVRSFPVNVRGGERKELSVTLERASAAGVRSADASAGQVGMASKPGASNAGAAAWLWAGGGAALLATGAGIYWINRNTDLSSCRSPAAGWRCTNESTIKTQRNIAVGATVGAGAAAVTMALIGILSWDYGPPSPKKHSALDCTASPFGISCARSF